VSARLSIAILVSAAIAIAEVVSSFFKVFPPEVACAGGTPPAVF